MKPMSTMVRTSPVIVRRFSARDHTRPKRKQPDTLTASVPHGNPDPAARWTRPESQYRANVPRDPASAIHNIFCSETSLKSPRQNSGGSG